MRSRRVNGCIFLCKKVNNENVQGSAIRAVKTDSEFSTRQTEKWVILIALQFCFTFCLPETKRLRAHKISLQANNKVYLGQIRSEEIVYSRFIKIPLG